MNHEACHWAPDLRKSMFPANFNAFYNTVWLNPCADTS